MLGIMLDVAGIVLSVIVIVLLVKDRQKEK